MTPIDDDTSNKINALVLATIALIGEPAHVDRGSRPADCWHDVYLTADSDGASVDLNVRAPFKTKGLWIIEVGRYSEGLSLRKRDINAIHPANLAPLIRDSLVAARRQRKANMSTSTWQVVADRINAATPRCALTVTATSSGLRLHIPSTLHVTEEQARAMMTLATSLGLVV